MSYRYNSEKSYYIPLTFWPTGNQIQVNCFCPNSESTPTSICTYHNLQNRSLHIMAACVSFFPDPFFVMKKNAFSSTNVRILYKFQYHREQTLADNSSLPFIIFIFYDHSKNIYYYNIIYYYTTCILYTVYIYIYRSLVPQIYLKPMT